MADSQAYRRKFFTNNLIFLGLCLLILLLVYGVADTLSGKKIDMTADEVYTVSDPTRDILNNLIDKVRVDYYVSSENLPSSFQTIVRDTGDMFEEFREISGGKLEYRVRDPDDDADEYAQKQVTEYFEVKARGVDPKEPEPVQTIEMLFSQRKPPSSEEIRNQRDQAASKIAASQGRPKDEVYRSLLTDEFKEQYKQKLEQDQIVSFPITESEAGSIRQVRVYSSIRISYLDRQPEIIPVHYSIENLEYELASRIVKLTTETKSVIAVFDARKPATPPMNPMNPMQQPQSQSEYAGIWGALREFFDVREVALTEGDSLDDLITTLKEEKFERENDDADDDAKGKALEGGIQPADFKLLSVLVVAQPHDLQDRQVYEINRAVSLGVKTIFLASRHSLDVSQQGMQQGFPFVSLQPGADFEDLLKSWGMELQHEVLGSNQCGAIQVPQRIAGFTMMAARPVSIAVSATRNWLSQDSALTNRIPALIFPTTVGMQLRQDAMDKAGLKSEVLARTSEQSWSVSIDPFRNVQNPMRRNQPPALVQYQRELIERQDENFTDWVDSTPLAALVTGKFPFKYQGQPVPAWKKEPEAPPGGMPPGFPGGGPHGGLPPGFGLGGGDRDETLDAVDPVDLAMLQEGDSPVAAETPAAPAGETAAATGDAPGAGGEGAEPAPPPEIADVQPSEGTVLFLASADMMKNPFLTQRGDYQSNINFFYNVVENFGLGDQLIQIRRKQLTARQFKPGSEDSYKPILWLNLVVVPFLVAIVGVVLFVSRRAQGVNYERNYLARHGKS